MLHAVVQSGSQVYRSPPGDADGDENGPSPGGMEGTCQAFSGEVKRGTLRLVRTVNRHLYLYDGACGKTSTFYLVGAFPKPAYLRAPARTFEGKIYGSEP